MKGNAPDTWRERPKPGFAGPPEDSQTFPPPVSQFAYPWSSEDDSSGLDPTVDDSKWFCLAMNMSPDQPPNATPWPLFRALAPFGLIALYRRHAPGISRATLENGPSHPDFVPRQWLFAFKSIARMRRAREYLENPKNGDAGHCQVQELPQEDAPKTTLFTSLVDWKYISTVYAESSLDASMRQTLLARAPRQWMFQSHFLDSASTGGGWTQQEIKGLAMKDGRNTRHCYEIFDVFDGRSRFDSRARGFVHTSPHLERVSIRSECVREYMLKKIEQVDSHQDRTALWRMYMVLKADMNYVGREHIKLKQFTVPLWATTGIEVQVIRHMAGAALAEGWGLRLPTRYALCEDLMVSADGIVVCWSPKAETAPHAFHGQIPPLRIAS